MKFFDMSKMDPDAKIYFLHVPDNFWIDYRPYAPNVVYLDQWKIQNNINKRCDKMSKKIELTTFEKQYVKALLEANYDAINQQYIGSYLTAIQRDEMINITNNLIEKIGE